MKKGSITYIASAWETKIVNSFGGTDIYIIAGILATTFCVGFFVGKEILAAFN